MHRLLDSTLPAFMEEPSSLQRIPAVTLGVVGSCELLLAAGIMAKSGTLVSKFDKGGVGNVLCVIDYDVTAEGYDFKGQVRRKNKLGGVGGAGPLMPLTVAVDGAVSAVSGVDRSACAEFRALSALSRRLEASGRIQGSVKLTVTEPPCLSCLSALLQFCSQHPQLRAEAIASLRIVQVVACGCLLDQASPSGLDSWTL